MRVPLTFPALGTTASLLVDADDALARAREIFEAEIDAIDRACSRFRADSELSLVNASAPNWCSVSAVFLDALDAALRGARLTDGRVDPTVGSSMRAIGYDRDFDRVDRTGPPLQVSVRAIPGWTTIEIDRSRSKVRVPRDVELDFGATAKALCADRAAVAIGTATGAAVLVGLGGDVAVGGPPRPEGWGVLVADHHGAAAQECDECIVIASGGVATSGTTARSWTRGDATLHHVIDPATGLSAGECWRTVSVSAGSCLDANIASTAAVVMGEHAIDWLAERRLPARLVTARGDVVRVGGWPAASEAASC